MSADERNSKTEEFKGSDDGAMPQKDADELKLPGDGSNADESGQGSTTRYASIGLGKPPSKIRPEGGGSSEQDENEPKRESLTYPVSFRVLMYIHRCKRRHVRGQTTRSLVSLMLTTDRRFN
jgi:hypothetical protein